MKKQIDLQLLATLAGGVLFNYLFWMERLALNLLLYSVFILTMLLLDQKIIKSKKMIFSGLAHLLAALLVVYNNSDLNVLTWYISLSIFIGFTYFPALRSVFFAISAAVFQAITIPINFTKKLLNLKIGNFSFKPFFRLFKYIVIPFLLITLFTTLYSFANATFANYVDLVLTNISTVVANVFNFIFADVSFIRILHVFFGILVTGALLIFYKTELLTSLELPFVEKLLRKRKVKKAFTLYNGLLMPPKPANYWKKMALKTESIIGIISFAALNFLIFSLNLIDVFNLWLKNPTLSTSSYSSELHSGTNALIWSIILAMSVILYFFRGNLNFYRKNKTIRILSYIWIIQNTFLISSVFLRDYNYIDAGGLTYKRIGVLVFLLLCSIGLVTVYIKVNQQKTFFYLFKINGLIWYGLLLFFGFVNWDVFIVNYNIDNNYSLAVDVKHALRMSDKTIPALDENRALLKTYVRNQHTASRTNSALTYREAEELAFDKLIDFRIKEFKRRYEETSWLSWNYRDAQTYRYLHQKEVIAKR